MTTNTNNILQEDTDKFCHSVLSKPNVINFFNSNVVTWAGHTTNILLIILIILIIILIGKVWDPEAYDLSSKLGKYYRHHYHH